MSELGEGFAIDGARGVHNYSSRAALARRIAAGTDLTEADALAILPRNDPLRETGQLVVYAGAPAGSPSSG
ncbi:hypothetical protein ACWFQT_02375 [Cellulosimicrobium cellulans]